MTISVKTRPDTTMDSPNTILVAKYVVEGYGGEEGNLRVTARYVVLPGGQRINVPAGIAAGPGAQPPNSERSQGRF